MRAALSSSTRPRGVSSNRRTSGSISGCNRTSFGSSFASAAETGRSCDKKPRSPSPASAAVRAVSLRKDLRCITTSRSVLEFYPGRNALVQSEIRAAAPPGLDQALHPLSAKNEGGGPRRGETNKNAPPLPSPLLHPMEEREKSRSLMQPCRAASFASLSSREQRRSSCTGKVGVLEDTGHQKNSRVGPDGARRCTKDQPQHDRK